MVFAQEKQASPILIKLTFYMNIVKENEHVCLSTSVWHIENLLRDEVEHIEFVLTVPTKIVNSVE